MNYFMLVCKFPTFKCGELRESNKAYLSCYSADKGDKITVYLHSLCTGEARCMNLLPYGSVSGPLPSLTLRFGPYQTSYTPKFLKN